MSVKEMKYKLYNGVEIPAVGFGTWQSKDGAEAYNAVRWALEYGYTHIDTAMVYGNEESVGRAIRDSKIPREKLFITTKLPANRKTYHEAIECFNKSCESLGVDYLDLYLIHAPWPWDNIGLDCTEGNIEAWKALLDLYHTGKIRAIGVSNFNVDQINSITSATGIKPMVNQIRYFIGNRQDQITNYCQSNNILIEAYSPMATGEMLDRPELIEIARKYNTTPAKICLRYCIENKTLPLPKSVKENRIKDNIDIDFEISREDMDYLDSLYHVLPGLKCRD